MSTVVIHPYSTDWPRQFKVIHMQLRDVFPDTSVMIEHIGSTSVSGLAAKPVIDIALGASSLSLIEAKIDTLARLGFEYVRKYERELPLRRYFVKPASGDVHRIHLHGLLHEGDLWRRHIAFRDALRTDADLQTRYQTLKLSLVARHADDKSAYTDAKAPFIHATLADLGV